MQLNIVTYNVGIQGIGGPMKHEINDFLVELNEQLSIKIDIVCFQEIYHTYGPYHKEDLDCGYTLYSKRSSSEQRGIGIAVIKKDNLEVIKPNGQLEHADKVHDGFEEEEVELLGLCLRYNGMQFRVISVYLPSGSSGKEKDDPENGSTKKAPTKHNKRTTTWTALKTRMTHIPANEPVIIAGDFNGYIGNRPRNAYAGILGGGIERNVYHPFDPDQQYGEFILDFTRQCGFVLANTYPGKKEEDSSYDYYATNITPQKEKTKKQCKCSLCEKKCKEYNNCKKEIDEEKSKIEQKREEMEDLTKEQEEKLKIEEEIKEMENKIKELKIEGKIIPPTISQSTIDESKSSTKAQIDFFAIRHTTVDAILSCRSIKLKGNAKNCIKTTHRPVLLRYNLPDLIMTTPILGYKENRVLWWANIKKLYWPKVRELLQKEVADGNITINWNSMYSAIKSKILSKERYDELDLSKYNDVAKRIEK